MNTAGTVVAVHLSASHTFSKPSRPAILLVEGLGVEGDAHLGETMKHRSRVKADPTQPNLRQVHLIHSELLDALLVRGFDVKPGDMGENVTTRGLDLLGLPTGALLRFGDEAVVRVTGLRNPCAQLDNFRPGLMQAVLDRDAEGNLVRKAGIMGVVVRGGRVRAGDAIVVELPDGEPKPLAPV
jgi:MOSC domain-containing protein YiiM